MVPKTSYPPHHPHPSLTITLSPSQTQQNLTTFLSQTPTNPYLHPDALLSTSGVSFSASSGPKGGLALHHLSRIERGLKGENLVLEGREELEERFGEKVDVLEGDDSRVDGVIEKRKRKGEDVAAWAEDASAHAGEGEGGEQGEWEAAQDLGEYELQQKALTGEVGERMGEVWQGGGVPEVVVAEEGEKSAKRAKTEVDKRARKEAKKARNKAEKGKKRGGAGEDD